MSGTNGAFSGGLGAVGPATIGIQGSGLTSALMNLLVAQGIEPGDAASYTLCKEIYLYHPLGGKIVDAPIRMAQSQPRELSMGSGMPEELLLEAFQNEWLSMQADEYIAAWVRVARIYGVSSLFCGDRKKSPNSALNLKELADADIYFSVFDPLNTSGSITLSQQPNSPDFQKPNDVCVAGEKYHRSRLIVLMNESPIYLAWTSSAYGFSGRSVYQRALYPLKSFIQTMITDDMVSLKAGLLIEKIKGPGSIINQVMKAAAGVKRAVLKQGVVGNVISIDIAESIETLNMMNLDAAGAFARGNILKNVATAVPMPARWITEDKLAEGFGEGAEDAKAEAVYVDSMRAQMKPGYEFMDRICMYRAWNPTFYKAVQEEVPEYAGVSYEAAFSGWVNAFKAKWPNFLQEPESEKSKEEKIKFDAMVQLGTLVIPALDPVNKATFIQWMQDNCNEREKLFAVPLQLDFEVLAAYVPPQPMAPGGEQGAEGKGENAGEGDEKADSVARLRSVA